MILLILFFLSIHIGNANDKNQPKLMNNDVSQLIPITTFKNDLMSYDFPSVLVGVAEYEEGPTGCTVIEFLNGAQSVVDVRGGLPGTVMGSAFEDGHTSAICFAGGSLLGFEAIAGITSALTKRDGTLQRVRGAVIWDYGVRDNMIYPDKTLGQAAVGALQTGSFPIGPHGAGRSATVGKWLLKPHTYETAGQGAAFLKVGDLRVIVFTVVNSVGGLIDRSGKPVRGHFNTETGKRAQVDELARIHSRIAPIEGNTTLTLVVTNAKLDRTSLQLLARHVHTSMARAIYPFHTKSDGDVLFAASTNEIDAKANIYEISHVASELAWEAVLRSYKNE